MQKSLVTKVQKFWTIKVKLFILHITSQLHFTLKKCVDIAFRQQKEKEFANVYIFRKYKGKDRRNNKVVVLIFWVYSDWFVGAHHWRSNFITLEDWHLD